MVSAVTYIVTSTTSIVTSLVAFAVPFLNPLDADANIATYLIVTPIGLALGFGLLGRVRRMIPGGGGRRRR